MEILFLNGNETGKYYGEMLEMLKEADEEFLPPLSARTSTTQKNLYSGEKNDEGILNYFEGMKKQSFVLACEEDRLLAFVSYRENYVCDEIDESNLPDIYISTLIVGSQARGKGITYKMYEKLFEKYSGINIFTRTWSTNNAHIKILSKFGFEEFKVLKNHRGRGVDTVYYKKK